MKNLNCLLFGLLLISSSLNSCSQSQDTNVIVQEAKPTIVWDKLAEGIEVLEIDAPKKSITGESKITIVKINPEHFDFQLLTATEHNKISRPVNEWADTFNLNVVLNAGMYELSNGLINRGYMKNYSHFNNSVFNPAYNSMIALNPVDTLDSRFAILDLKCESWENVKSDYHCFAQGMRMIDCNGEALGWNKKKQSCSMLVAAIDPLGNIYFIFSRSPYTHNEMISFMLEFPLDLSNAIYLEGGPETSLYIKVGDKVIEKVGSYVSQTYPNDNNNHFWKLPNVIGLRLKEGN
jgi:hypothetical protein